VGASWVKAELRKGNFYAGVYLRKIRMKIHAECFPCLLNQVLKNARKLKPKMENHAIIDIQRAVMQKIIKENQTKLPYYGKIVYDTLAEYLHEIDPYRKIKQRDNNRVLKLIPSLTAQLAKSQDPLQLVVKFMIIGNTIDFGAPYNSDLWEDLEKINELHIPDEILDEFEADLEKSSQIMIIGDNCGEAVFDKIFVEYLKKHYPAKRIFYGVRGGPAINDITLKEAEEIGITSICNVVEGSACPGVIFEEVSPEFSQAFHSSDLILAKGQGNFESLEGISHESENRPKGSLYFLLKAKCEVVAAYFNVPIGSLIIKKEL